MIAVAGTSAAVSTAWTPGRSRARFVSIDTRRACACGERSTAAWSMPGTRTSSTNRPVPGDEPIAAEAWMSLTDHRDILALCPARLYQAGTAGRVDVSVRR